MTLSESVHYAEHKDMHGKVECPVLCKGRAATQHTARASPSPYKMLLPDRRVAAEQCNYGRVAESRSTTQVPPSVVSAVRWGEGEGREGGFCAEQGCYRDLRISQPNW